MADVPEYQFPEDWNEQVEAHIMELNAMPKSEMVGWALVDDEGRPALDWYLAIMQYGPCWGNSVKSTNDNKDKFIGAFSESGAAHNKMVRLGLHEEVVWRTFEAKVSTSLSGQRLVVLKYQKNGRF